VPALAVMLGANVGTAKVSFRALLKLISLDVDIPL
jgi:Na+/phosphate symporter